MNGTLQAVQENEITLASNTASLPFADFPLLPGS